MGDSLTKYTIDTCSLTKLRTVYPKDVFPSVWDKMGDLADTGILISTEEVYEELKTQDDDVLEWADAHRNIFLELDEQIQREAINILNLHPKLIDIKKHKSGADPFVISTAIIKSCTVVTEEKPSGGPNKPKIPDVCKDFNVKCIVLLDLLRIEGLRL